MTEWNRFQTYHPASITIGACAVNGVCGGTSNSCSAGSPSGYNPGVCGGFQTWNCLGLNGGSNASCSIANGACPINGVCGGTSNSCSAGSPSGYNPGVCGGFQTWTCLGLNGGSNASCSIANGACPINGVCGGTSNSCSAGSPSGYNPGVCGGSASWNCLGLNGGSNASCSMSNSPCPITIPGTYIFDAYYPTLKNELVNIGGSDQIYGTYTVTYEIGGAIDNIGCSRAEGKVQIRNTAGGVIGDGGWIRPPSCDYTITQSFNFTGTPASVFLDSNFLGVDVNGQWHGHVLIRNIVLQRL